MKIKLVVLTFVALLVGCGPSEADVSNTVEKAIAESEAKTMARIDDLADAQVQMSALEKAIAESEAKTMDRIDDLADAQVRMSALEKAIAESEAKTMDRIDDLADAQVQMSALEKAIAESEAKTMARIDDLADVQVQMSALEKAIAESEAKTMARIDEIVNDVSDQQVGAICALDYWRLTQISAMAALIDYLSGGDSTLEYVTDYFYGIEITGDYADTSRICDLGEDGDWDIIWSTRDPRAQGF